MPINKPFRAQLLEEVPATPQRYRDIACPSAMADGGRCGSRLTGDDSDLQCSFCKAKYSLAREPYALDGRGGFCDAYEVKWILRRV